MNGNIKQAIYRSTIPALIFIIVLSLNSCLKIELHEIDNELINKEFIGYLDVPTKTSLNNDGSIDWSKGDSILYYSASDGIIGKHIIENDCHATKFTAKIGSKDSFFTAAFGATSIEEHSDDNLTLKGAITPVQTGKFKDAHVSIAKTLDLNSETLQFSNITSLIKFSLARNDIDYIEFSSADSTKIHGSGTLDISFAGTIATASFGTAGGARIRVNTKGAGTFYISTLPCEICGFNIECFSSLGECIGTVTGEKQLSLKKNTITNLGALDSRIQAVPITNLSTNGTSNCYIVSSSGKYKINASVRGNSLSTIEGTASKASVLWESFGTDVAPKPGEIVKYVSYNDGEITFTSGKDGNALIAVQDNTGKILWSWHIWVCNGYDPDATGQEYSNHAGKMMDRNLGATSATPGDVHALGLLYQWGRKDPFLGGGKGYFDSNNNQQKAASTLEWPQNNEAWSNMADGCTIKYSISHPTTFIQSTSSPFDWYCNSINQQNDLLWSSTKTEYDPCPNGWRVPDGSPKGVWSTSFATSDSLQTSSIWNDNKFGIDYSGIWYPASGYIAGNNTLCGVGYEASIASCIPVQSNEYAYCFTFNNKLAHVSDSKCKRVNGMSVRCISENCTPIVIIDSVGISDKNISLQPEDSTHISATVYPLNANITSITWSTSNSNVATITQNGLITAIGEGNCIITAKAYDGTTAECTVTVKLYPYVDLGLSVKWSKCNLSASSPSESGYFFAFGDTSGQYWTGSKWSYFGFNSYPSFSLDSKNNLALNNDAAYKKLGAGWRMPTFAEFQELSDPENCSITWVSNYKNTGTAGRLFVSKKKGYVGRSIFLPASGGGQNNTYSDANSCGRYWTSTAVSSNVAYDYCFYSTYAPVGSSSISLGRTIRPVHE